jgi:hypothetical protein
MTGAGAFLKSGYGVAVGEAADTGDLKGEDSDAGGRSVGGRKVHLGRLRSGHCGGTAVAATPSEKNSADKAQE